MIKVGTGNWTRKARREIKNRNSRSKDQWRVNKKVIICHSSQARTLFRLHSSIVLASKLFETNFLSNDNLAAFKNGYSEVLQYTRCSTRYQNSKKRISTFPLCMRASFYRNDLTQRSRLVYLFDKATNFR